jgi:hypothetical protein
MEIWKDIPGYEGFYQASSMGRIKSVEGKVTHSTRHGKRVWHERILKPKKCANFRLCGYRVTLWKNKQCKDYLVARLVATTFHENLIDTEMTVNHKDGDRLNNRINNLEWLTLADNIRHGFNTGLYHTQKQTVLTAPDGSVLTFQSRTEASAFLGKGHGYIHSHLSKGRGPVLPSGYTVQL